MTSTKHTVNLDTRVQSPDHREPSPSAMASDNTVERRDPRHPALENHVFIDAEFTDLLEPQLLSIGMVSWDAHEFYAELDPSLPESASTFEQASDFVRTCGVLEQWGRVPDAAVSRLEMGLRCADWLLQQAARSSQSGGSLVIAFDYEPDYALLEECIRDANRWEAVRAVIQPFQVTPEYRVFEANLGADAAYQALRKRGLERHHALADAHALRAAAIALHTGKRVQL